MSQRKPAPSRPPGSRKKRRRLPIVIGMAVALVVSAAVFLWWRGGAAVEPPGIPAADLDPAIARMIEKARDAVVQSPRSATAWGDLGKAFWVYDFKTEALFCFEQAERRDQQNPRWPYFAGLSCFPDRADEGIIRLARAVGRFEETAEAPRLRFAQILAERGRMDEAEPFFKDVLARNPQQGAALLGMAKIQLARGKIEESRDCVQRSLAIVGTSKSAWTLAATVYQRLGLEEAAAEAHRRAASLPNDPPFSDPFIDEASQWRTGKKAWLDHAQQLIRQGRPREAEPLLERTVRDYPEFPDAWIALGGIQIGKKDFAGAERSLRRAVELAPISVEAKSQLGVALMYQNRPSEAASQFQFALKLQPTLGEAHFNLGLCQSQLQQREPAMESFRNAIRFKPDLPDAHIALANLLVQSGERDEAIAQLQKALQIAPNDARAGQLLEQIRAK
jgi:tetratricopeptide (TPR) repeat protein